MENIFFPINLNNFLLYELLEDETYRVRRDGRFTKESGTDPFKSLYDKFLK